MIWPFNFMPWPLNFLALWAGYSFLLITVYCALMATLRWWVHLRYRDQVEEWAEMRRKAQKVRDRFHGQN